MKLPQEIAAEFTRLTGENAPVTAARALADVQGNLGEAYAICTQTTLHVLSRRLGDKIISFIYPFPVIRQLSVEDDRPFAFLVIETGDETLRLKFGGLDVEDLRKIIDLWRGTLKQAQPVPAEPEPEPEPEPAAPPPETGELPLFTGFCAALKTMMEVDGAVDTEENHYFQRLIDSPTTVAQALDYLRVHGTDGLAASLAERMNKRQKLCLVANLMEIAMVDGYLKGPEQELIAHYAETFKITDDEKDAIFEVLSIKNNLSVFTL